ncbi:hypothetical protein CSKR_104946 [Clonorchis sinensis]|uniref:Coiled-coil domain-containing protein 60 n=1 Tax=Clonorchis sinensis TaxID=79923 RepID=A0A8T1N0Y5_CLOSI|nr:hypothetical protein CSKR_104946 [Clonorchis sinensis]
MSLADSDSPKVCTRTQTLLVLSRPTRKEVCQENLKRRQIQLDNEGFFTPLGQPYREVGGPVYTTARGLVQNTLGAIPKKIDMLNAYQTREELTGYDPSDPENAEAPIPDVDTLELSSTSAERALEGVRRSGLKSSPRNKRGADKQNQPQLKYMERRRKHGGVDVKQVLKESNASLIKVKRGKRMFEMLSDELCDKINQFWEKRDHFEQRRKTELLPPQRKYLDIDYRRPSEVQNAGWTGRKTKKQLIADKTLYEELIKAERHLEEEAIGEDKLLSQEPEIGQLTQQIYENAPTLLNTISVLKSIRSDTASAVSRRGSKTPVFTLAVERRRRRLKNQWAEEQPRPFAPLYINLGRPDISAEVSNGHMSPVLGQIEYESHLESTEDLNEPGSGQNSTFIDNENRSTTEGVTVKEFFLQDMLFAQLSCLLWLLEQMLRVEREKEVGSTVISTSWKWKKSAESDPSAAEIFPRDVERAWRQFVLQPDPLAKPRKRLASITGLKWGSRPSSRTSSTWRVSSSRRSARDSGRTSASNTDRALDNVRKLLSASSLGDNLVCEKTRKASSSSRITPESVAFSMSDAKTSSNNQSSASLPGRNVKFMENVELLDFDEREEEEQHPLSQHKWITLHELRDTFTREMISDMANAVASRMKEEENKENPKKNVNFPEIKITAADLDKEKLAKLNYSDKWRNLPSTMRKQLEELKEQYALKFQDRTDYQRQLRSKVCLAKYQTIPANAPLHVAIRDIQHKAPYADALAVLAKQKAEYKELSPWYVDLLDELDELQFDKKISTAVKRLEYYAQLPSGQFTVLQFTRVLRSLELWELCLPMVAAATDYIRSRILDMTLEEYIDWLHQTYSEMKDLNCE